MLYVLTKNGIFYRINCDKRTYEIVQGEDVQEERKGDVDVHMQDESAAVSDFTCGTNFLLTLRGNQNLFSKGANECGQLGIGSFDAQEQFKCIESLIDINVKEAYAGSRSSFAVCESTNSMQEFLREFTQMNRDDAEVPAKKGIIELKTAEGDQRPIYVHSTIYNAYFAPGAEKNINLDRISAMYLLRFLYGELYEEGVWQWIKDQIKTVFEGDATAF